MTWETVNAVQAAKDPFGNEMPPRLRFKDNGYYRVQKQKWTHVGHTYAEAIRA